MKNVDLVDENVKIWSVRYSEEYIIYGIYVTMC